MIDEVASVGLHRAPVNARAKLCILLDKAQGSSFHQLLRIDAVVTCKL